MEHQLTLEQTELPRLLLQAAGCRRHCGNSRKQFSLLQRDSNKKHGDFCETIAVDLFLTFFQEIYRTKYSRTHLKRTDFVVKKVKSSRYRPKVA
jgi:hypothetical protein